MRILKRLAKRFAFVAVCIFLLGFIVPQNLQMPVEGASSSSYNPASFWYYPWGSSGTHKGVDIFARKGTNLSSASSGLVLHTGTSGKGGNYVLILGPKWRLHYYAHLNSIETSRGALVSNNMKIGTVGDSGNAKGKAAHLHYTIKTLIPYPWRIDNGPQGWRKMFYLNPIDYFN